MAKYIPDWQEDSITQAYLDGCLICGHCPCECEPEVDNDSDNSNDSNSGDSVLG